MGISEEEIYAIFENDADIETYKEENKNIIKSMKPTGNKYEFNIITRAYCFDMYIMFNFNNNCIKAHHINAIIENLGFSVDLSINVLCIRKTIKGRPVHTIEAMRYNAELYNAVKKLPVIL